VSLGIVVKGPEGLVLAAESRLTLDAKQPDGRSLQVGFDNARKVFGFAEPHKAVGVVTYGLGGIGLRSAYSFVPELKEHLPTTRLPVYDFATSVSEFYMRLWRATMPPDFAGPAMTLVVAGFNEGEAYGRVYVIDIPTAPEPRAQAQELDAFGITWGGQREIVDRLLRGYDERTMVIAAEALRLSEAQVGQLRTALEPLQMQLPLPAMPLQDCVDLAILFVKTTVEAQRLTVGVRGCGGPIDVATITREEGLRFVQRKEIRGEGTSVRGGPTWDSGR
jgi:hypothetical protein